MKFIVNEPISVLELLVAKLKLASITKARNLVKEGSVHVDNKHVLRGDQLLKKGQVVQIKKGGRRVQKAPFEVLLNDDSVIVAVKPAGVLSVNRDGESSDTFAGRVGTYLGHRVSVVHRLDREVSGIMIFAKTPEAAKRLEDAWRDNDKRYLALVEGKPEKERGTLESWLAENAAFKVYATTNQKEGKQAVTHFKVLSKEGVVAQEFARNVDAKLLRYVRNSSSQVSLVEVQLETGRKHQIRVHLADMGCPIVGDKKYGAKTDPYRRIALHAYRFAFTHPITGERLSFESPFPLRLKI